MIFASFGSKQGCLRGMAWQTSIEAAQRFLGSVKTLSSYGDIVETQNAGVLRALNKVATLTPTQASTWLQQIAKTLGALTRGGFS